MRGLVRRHRITALLEAAFALVAVFVLMAPGGRTGTARVELSRAAGTLSLGNSREGSAIFQALNMRPGQQASGSVRVTNTGTLPAALTLAPSALAAADAASRLLGARLQLVVSDVTDAGRPVTVYAGPLATMPATSLGALAAGRGRDFLFVSTLPDGGVADNALQGATFVAGFVWTAVAAAPAGTPTPNPKPRPTPVPTVTPTPTPPPAGTCKPRKVRIRIHRRHGHHARRVMVKVGHKHAHRAKVRRGKVTVKVRGHKRVRIKVVVRYPGGHHTVIHRRARGRCVVVA